MSKTADPSCQSNHETTKLKPSPRFCWKGPTWASFNPNPFGGTDEFVEVSPGFMLPPVCVLGFVNAGNGGNTKSKVVGGLAPTICYT